MRRWPARAEHPIAGQDFGGAELGSDPKRGCAAARPYRSLPPRRLPLLGLGQPPLLVAVTGMPAAGKTMLAKSLRGELRLPLIVRDEIKERLYEELGTGDIEWSNRLGSAAFGLLFDFRGGPASIRNL